MLKRQIAAAALAASLFAGSAFGDGLFVPARPQWIVWSSSAVSLTAGSTNYLNIGANAAEANIQFPAPFSGTIRNLGFTAANVPGSGAGKTYTATVRVGNADTAVVCAITNTAGTGQCSPDTTLAVAVTAGQTVSVSFVITGTANATAVSGSYTIQ